MIYPCTKVRFVGPFVNTTESIAFCQELIKISTAPANCQRVTLGANSTSRLRRAVCERTCNRQ